MYNNIIVETPDELKREQFLLTQVSWKIKIYV